MRVLRKISQGALPHESCVAAIGIFDGVHRGHQRILKKTVVQARAIGAVPLAVTFFPHPLSVLAPQLVPPLLLSLSQRLKAFSSCGIRVVLVVPFTRSFSRWRPVDFVERLLVERLRVREVVVGHDFGFGHKRSGTTQTLTELGRRFGFRVHVVRPIRVGKERVSSRRIRELIQAGKLSKACRFLSRPIGVAGRVIHGACRGATIGFPTANLAIKAGVLPPVGVYAVFAKMNGRSYRGMCNIGYRPTFQSISNLKSQSSNLLLEVHLFGIRRLLYGREMEVSFIRRLRAERRFPSARDLKIQLRKDSQAAKRILKARP